MSLVLALEPLARTSEGSKAGPIGLGVILLLCIACYFLFKSMSKHMRYVRENFPGTGSAPAVRPVADAGPAAVEPGGTAESTTDAPPPVSTSKPGTES